MICTCWTTPYMLWLCLCYQLVCNVCYLLKRLPESCLLSCQHLFFTRAPALRGCDLSVWLALFSSQKIL